MVRKLLIIFLLLSSLFPSAVEAVSGTLAFLQGAEDGTDADNWTFSAQNLGVAAADRYIIITIHVRGAGNAVTIDTVTIGGVSASIVAQVRNTTTNTNVGGIAIALVPTGTTGDVFVDVSHSCLRAAITMYRATGLASITASDFGTSVDANPNYALDVPADGFAIGGANVGVTTDAFGWTNLTEDIDDEIEVINYSSASDTFDIEQVDLAITANPGSTTNVTGVFASWAFGSSATRNRYRMIF